MDENDVLPFGELSLAKIRWLYTSDRDTLEYYALLMYSVLCDLVEQDSVSCRGGALDLSTASHLIRDINDGK